MHGKMTMIAFCSINLIYLLVYNYKLYDYYTNISFLNPSFFILHSSFFDISFSKVLNINTNFNDNTGLFVSQVD